MSGLLGVAAFDVVQEQSCQDRKATLAACMLAFADRYVIASSLAATGSLAWTAVIATLLPPVHDFESPFRYFKAFLLGRLGTHG